MKYKIGDIITLKYGYTSDSGSRYGGAGYTECIDRQVKGYDLIINGFRNSDVYFVDGVLCGIFEFTIDDKIEIRDKKLDFLLNEISS